MDENDEESTLTWEMLDTLGSEKIGSTFLMKTFLEKEIEGEKIQKLELNFETNGECGEDWERENKDDSVGAVGQNSCSSNSGDSHDSAPEVSENLGNEDQSTISTIPPQSNIPFDTLNPMSISQHCNISKFELNDDVFWDVLNEFGEAASIGMSDMEKLAQDVLTKSHKFNVGSILGRRYGLIVDLLCEAVDGDKLKIFPDQVRCSSTFRCKGMVDFLIGSPYLITRGESLNEYDVDWPVCVIQARDALGAVALSDSPPEDWPKWIGELDAAAGGRGLSFGSITDGVSWIFCAYKKERFRVHGNIDDVGHMEPYGTLLEGDGKPTVSVVFSRWYRVLTFEGNQQISDLEEVVVILKTIVALGCEAIQNRVERVEDSEDEYDDGYHDDGEYYGEEEDYYGEGEEGYYGDEGYDEQWQET